MNPQQGSDEEQRQLIEALLDRGLQPTNLSIRTNSGFSQKLIFPYAIVNKGEKEININLLQQRMGISPEEVLNNSIQNIEYAYISLFVKS
nr:Gldg family protein [Sphingobacterium sp. T2]